MALLPELSREQRRLARMRGAGRVLLPADPPVYQRRKSIKAPLEPIEPNDQLVAIKDAKTPVKARGSEPSQSARRRNVPVMTFRTPKTRTPKVKTPGTAKTPGMAMKSPSGVNVTPINRLKKKQRKPKASPAKMSSPVAQSQVQPAPEQNTQEVGSSAPVPYGHDDSIPSPSRQSPGGYYSDGADVSRQDDADPVQYEAAIGPPQVDAPKASTKSLTPPRSIKRKRVPENAPAVKPKAKRLKGLLRELGPGASRFIVGAKNYATPEKTPVETRRASTRVVRVSKTVSVPIRVIKVQTRVAQKETVKSKTVAKPVSDEVLSLCVLREMGLTWKAVGLVLKMAAQKASKIWQKQTGGAIERASEQAKPYALGQGRRHVEKAMPLRPLVNCKACQRRAKDRCAGKCEKRVLLENDFIRSLLRTNRPDTAASADALDLVSSM